MEANIVQKLDILKNLPKQKQIAAAILLGAAVSDAAIAPVHWVYDVQKIKDEIGDKNPEFWPTSLNPFYKIALGKHTVYYDTTQVMINHLSQNQTYNEKQYQTNLQSFYGSPDSPYQIALKERLENRKNGIKTPVQGPWINHSLITFLDNIKNKQQTPSGDPNQMDPDGFCGSLPVIAQQLATNSKNLDVQLIENVIKVLNTKPENLQFAVSNAKILSLIFENQQLSQGDLLSKLLEAEKNQNVIQAIQEVQEQIKLGTGHLNAVGLFGRACPYPGNYKSALHSILTAKDYVQGVRQTLLAGGDNCSRGVFVGAVLGAKFGLEGIPVEWIQKTEGNDQLIDQLIKIFS